MVLQDLCWDSLPDSLPRREELQKRLRRGRALRWGLAYSDTSSSPHLEVQRQHPQLWHRKKNQQSQNMNQQQQHCQQMQPTAKKEVLANQVLSVDTINFVL